MVGNFTWYNSQSASRIDRVLLSPNVLDEWPNCSLIGLLKNLSDHCPLLFLSSDKFDWGPKQFRSLDSWQSKDGFENMLAKLLVDINSNFAGGSLCSKLRELRKDLRKLNKESFGDQNCQLASL